MSKTLSSGSRLVSQSLLVLQVRALPGGQVTIQFRHVFEDRHARQRLHDLEDFLDLRLHVDEGRLATALLELLRVEENTRRPALLMNFNSARSNTRSLTERASTGASCSSNSGAVAVSRLPVSLTVMAGALVADVVLNPDFEWHSGLCRNVVVAYKDYSSEDADQVLDQAQDIPASFAP